MSNGASRYGSMRAADTDRIQVAQLLTDAAAAGPSRDDRVRGAAEEGVRRADVRRAGPTQLRPAGHRHHGVRRSAPGRPAPSTLLLAIMSGFERRGRWNVPKRLTSVALFGGGVIDLRYADFTSPDVEIHSYSIFGGQTILLPPELNVDVQRRRRDGRLRPPRRRRAPPARRTSPFAASRCGAASASSARSARPLQVRSAGAEGVGHGGACVVSACQRRRRDLR